MRERVREESSILKAFTLSVIYASHDTIELNDFLNLDCQEFTRPIAKRKWDVSTMKKLLLLSFNGAVSLGWLFFLNSHYYSHFYEGLKKIITALMQKTMNAIFPFYIWILVWREKTQVYNVIYFQPTPLNPR